MTIANKRTCVIIPNYVAPGKQAQNEWLLKRLLISLHTYEPSVKVVIVDDGSNVSPSYYYKFSSMIPGGYVFIKNEQNMGFANTVNNGLKYAIDNGYDYGVLVNNDIELIGPFLNQMHKCYDAFDKLFLWGPRLLYPSGLIQSAGYEINSEGEVKEYDKHNHILTQPGTSNESKFVLGITGAFMGIDLAKTKDTGLLDESYFLAYEDVDYCLNSWSKGYWNFYDSTVDVLHDESATRGGGLTKIELQSLARIKDRVKNHYSLPRIKLLVLGAMKFLRENIRHGLQKQPEEGNE